MRCEVFLNVRTKVYVGQGVWIAQIDMIIEHETTNLAARRSSPGFGIIDLLKQ